jgi:8-oxo-dGTP pyrophosphatase MutT (NUDIX family)
MGEYVYAVVYSKAAGKCLVFKKKEKGYYFHSKKGFEYKKDGQTLHGGNAYCFPGGGLKAGENHVAGAIREFKEETGVCLIQEAKQSTWVLFNNAPNPYFAIFFGVGKNMFNRIFEQCRDNLKAKEAWGNPPPQATVEAYVKEARTHNLPYIQDDELELVEAVSVDQLLDKFTQSDPDTGWFYNIVQHFLMDVIDPRE